MNIYHNFCESLGSHGGACKTHTTDDTRSQSFGPENLKEREHLEDPEAYGRIIHIKMNTEEDGPVVGSFNIWEDSIKMVLREIRWDIVDYGYESLNFTKWHRIH